MNRSVAALLLACFGVTAQTVQTDNGMYVTANYTSVLARMPDPGGWIFQKGNLDQGASRDAMTHSFIVSPEYGVVFGAPDNDGFTTLMYQNGLYRSPSPAELSWRVGQLNSGYPRWAVARDVIYSAEFSANARNIQQMTYRTDWSMPHCATLDAGRWCVSPPASPLVATAGVQAELTVRYTNAYGQADFGQGQVIISAQRNVLSGTNACYLGFDASGGYNLGGVPGPASNQWCTVSRMDRSISGGTLTFTFLLTFPASFGPQHTVWAAGWNQEGLFSEWKLVAQLDLATPPTQYYLTTAVNATGGGSISPASGWYTSGTVVPVSAAPAAGYQFSGFSGALSGTATPQNLVMNSARSVTANFAVVTSYTATTVTELQNCIQNMTNVTTCVLKERPEPYSITSTIEINRSNVVVRGGTTGMNDTKLVRNPSFTGDLIRIGQNASVSGVALKYLTVCGGSNITPDWGPAPPSPVGCPRVPTVCGDRTRLATQHPGAPGQLPQCVDISVVRSALPVFPLDPFNSLPASYAVEFDHVDLEDATGHALSLYGYNGTHIDDIYFHHGAINYSGVTGILLGVGGVDYGRKFCDGYADPVLGFANDRNVYAPRNIRVEHSQFTENRTGVTGGLGRWIAFRNNTFTRNYIWPQAQGGAVPDTNPPVGDPNESWGGTLEFDACADQIQVTNNTFTGPGADHPKTQALELYGRNITIDGNSVSGYQLQGIVANSVDRATIRNNSITFAAATDPADGGITVSTVGAGGACTDTPLNIYRESKIISITGNSIWGQHYGVNLAEHPYRSTGAIHNLSIGTNYGNWATAQYWQNAFVWANAYNGYSGPPTTLGRPELDRGITPRVLPVDAESSSTRALCSLPGTARASFTFAASDDSNGSANLTDYQPRIDYGAPGYAGAAQILYLQGVFSNAGPPGGPSNTAQDCHFYYAADANVVYLDDGTGTWGYGSSPVGPGGHDLTNPYGCTIHAATSSASVIQPGQYARSVTLDVEFSGTTPARKHIYAYTMNKNGTHSYAQYDPHSPVIWQYWGWWQKP